MQPSRRSLRRTIVPVCVALGNTEIACLVDAPLFDAGDDLDLVLTSDEWVALLLARRAAGRAVHFAEVA